MCSLTFTLAKSNQIEWKDLYIKATTMFGGVKENVARIKRAQEKLHCILSDVGWDSPRPRLFWAEQQTLMSLVTLKTRTLCDRRWRCTVRPY